MLAVYVPLSRLPGSYYVLLKENKAAVMPFKVLRRLLRQISGQQIGIPNVGLIQTSLEGVQAERNQHGNVLRFIFHQAAI